MAKLQTGFALVYSLHKRVASIDKWASKQANGHAAQLLALTSLKYFFDFCLPVRYSACFGTELAMNNQLATHFRTYFQMDAADASALAGAFGLMNLFARSGLLQ